MIEDEEFRQTLRRALRLRVREHGAGNIDGRHSGTDGYHQGDPRLWPVEAEWETTTGQLSLALDQPDVASGPAQYSAALASGASR